MTDITPSPGQSHTRCPCGGTGSCVQIIQNTTRTDAFDAVRMDTLSRTGLDLIQKHALISNRTVYTHSAKDLFSILNRNRGELSITWMRTQAQMTFLHAAVITGRMEIIPVLIDCGLFLDLFDCVVRDPHSVYSGHTAMEIADMQRNKKMLTFLPQQKKFAENLGWMHRVARDGNLKAVKWLWEKHPSLLTQPMAPVDIAPLSSPVQLHTGTEPIYWAVTSGSAALVNFMMSKGANKHSTSSEGETLLTRASSLGLVEMVKLIVEELLLDPNEPGYEQKTALQLAVLNKDVSMVRTLQQLNVPIPNWLLNDVAKVGHVQIFSMLREHFYNLDLQDEMGKFPLYYAIQNNNLQMAEELIKSGAKLFLQDRQKRNLLHLAVSRYDEDTFQFVMRHLQQKKYNRRKKVICQLINQRDRYVGAERCFLVRGKDKGTTAYHYVNVNRFCMSVFRKMARDGSTIDVMKYGTTVLSGWGAEVPPDVLETIEKKYDITKVTDSTVEDMTPLNLAILKENYDMAMTLIDCGADVNLADCFGLTPLHMACMRGALNVVRHLEKKRASMTVTDVEGHTPLDIAVANHHNHVVNFLKGYTIVNLKDMEEFRRALGEYAVKVSDVKLQEVRAKGLDVKRQLIKNLQMLQADIDSMCTVLGYGPVRQESGHDVTV